MSERARMETGTRPWLGRAAALALGGFALAAVPACLENPLGSKTYEQASATDNKTYAGTGPTNSDFSDAVQASGAHDIPCPITQVKAHWVKEHDWAADGCGVHVTYTARHKFAVPWQMTLVSRSKMATPPPVVAPVAAPVTPAAPMNAPVAAGGCSKDVDCKGERICIDAVCVDPPPKPVPY